MPRSATLGPSRRLICTTPSSPLLRASEASWNTTLGADPGRDLGIMEHLGAETRVGYKRLVTDK